jgi:hypothetical protein
MLKYVILLIIINFFQIGYSQDTANHISSTQTVKFDIILDSINYGEFFKQTKFTVLETTEQSRIEKLRKVRILNDEIFCLDKGLNTIFVFDYNTGKYLRKYSSNSLNTSKFSKMNDFDFADGNGLIILVDNQWLIFIDEGDTIIKELELRR